jgi:AcrR family transcriptional regulator
MKAPVSRRPETVTGRILDAAQAEFMAAGYEAASTNQITATFGGSKATLFRYFPTKEQLLEAVIRRIALRWQGAVAAREIEATAPKPWLIVFATRVLGWILQDEPLFVGRLAIAEGHKFPRLSQVFQEAAGGPLQAVLAERLHSWTAKGELACDDPARDAMQFLDLVVTGAVSRALYRQKAMTARELAVHVESSVDLFLNGRAPRAHAPSSRRDLSRRVGTKRTTARRA